MRVVSISLAVLACVASAIGLAGGWRATSHPKPADLSKPIIHDLGTIVVDGVGQLSSLFEIAIPDGYVPHQITVGSSCCTAAKIVHQKNGLLAVVLTGKHGSQTISQRWFAVITAEDPKQPKIMIAMQASTVPRAGLVDSAQNTRVVVRDKPQTWETLFEIRDKTPLPSGLKPALAKEIPGVSLQVATPSLRQEGELTITAFPVTFVFSPEGAAGPRLASLGLAVPGTDYRCDTQIAWSVEKP